MYPYHYRMVQPGGDWFLGLIGMIFWLLVIGGGVYLLIHLLRRHDHNFFTNTPPETSLDIAKKRYARGEITKEEFDKLKVDLQD